MTKLISCSLMDMFKREYKNLNANKPHTPEKYGYTNYHVSHDILERDDLKQNTFMCIFGPAQDDYLEQAPKALAACGGKIVYQAPTAINFEHRTDKTRNTLVLIEFD